MRLSIRAQQVAGVTLLVGASMAVLSAFHLASVARIGVQESLARGDLLVRALYQQARQVRVRTDPYRALRDDPGIRSLLESSLAYGRGVTYAAITDPAGTIVAHGFPSLEGSSLPEARDLRALAEASAWTQLRTIYADQTLELAEPLTLGDRPFGAIRIGLSTVLIRDDLRQALTPIAVTTLVVLLLASAVAMGLAGWILRPIHVITAGLGRLGRGELDVTLDLPPHQDFADLGDTFKAISAQLAEREGHAGETPAAEKALQARRLASLGRLLAGMAHEVKNPLNAMTIHVELTRQKVEALARPSGREPGTVLGLDGPEAAPPAPGASGVAETTGQAALRHLTVISDEIRRLDQVIQGFLRFVRPETLSPRPVALRPLAEEVLALVEPNVRTAGITAQVDCPDTLPPVHADATMLRQALLNLALNACQAMPAGGRLRIGGRARQDQVIVEVEDTGTGIPPDQLERIFDLYYTTREHGSGFGLSMVYRIVLLHGGDIEVESTPDVGTLFRLSLPRSTIEPGTADAG